MPQPTPIFLLQKQDLQNKAQEKIYLKTKKFYLANKQKSSIKNLKSQIPIPPRNYARNYEINLSKTTPVLFGGFTILQKYSMIKV